MKNVIYLLLSITLVCHTSCEEFIEIESPRTDLIRTTVFEDDATAVAAMDDIYGQLTLGFGGGSINSFTFLGSLSADELVNYNTDEEYIQFSSNSIASANTKITSSWSDLYQFIYKANAIIEGLTDASDITEDLKKQLEGEAKFMRAFSYFYLANLFGDVPLVLTTDYLVNASLPRTDISELYEQMISDLIDAQNLLPDNYSFSNNLRVRPNKGCATALLARVYLYRNDWANAEEQATLVIENPQYVLVALSDVFLTSSKEAIWQLGKVSGLASEAVTFNFPIRRNAALSSSLLKSFEDGDQRSSVWIASIIEGDDTIQYTQKYRSFNVPPTEYSTVLRLAELYLIRSEARARQNKLIEAVGDIDMIRQRAQLPLIQNVNPNIDQSELLLAIEQERRVELVNEWGHRWLDIIRTGRVDFILEMEKGNVWKPTATLYPIPQVQILNNPSMREAQNPGYE